MVLSRRISYLAQAGGKPFGETQIPSSPVQLLWCRMKVAVQGQAGKVPSRCSIGFNLFDLNGVSSTTVLGLIFILRAYNQGWRLVQGKAEISLKRVVA